MKMARIKYIVGVDEAGRGPLAGPITIGVVCARPRAMRLFAGVRDSKKLTPAAREKWFQKICAHAARGRLSYGVAFVGNRAIDQEGIVGATRKAIARTLARLPIAPHECILLLDGSLSAPEEYIFQRTIIGGDDKVRVIAAASIVAKVKRDRRMIRLAKKFPQYGFDIHKGYGTKLHKELIQKHGLSPVHRTSYCKNLAS